MHTLIIREKALGQNNHFIATSLNNLVTFIFRRQT